MRNVFGKTVLKLLREKVIKKLKEDGYEILENVTLEDKTLIDFIGIKDGRKIGVKIFIRPNKRITDEKSKHYSKFLNNFVFAVPKSSKYKPEKCWEFDTPSLDDLLKKSEQK